MLSVKNEQFKNYSRIFKDAGKYSRTTRCFSRIKDITSFDCKFKNNSRRSRTSGKNRTFSLTKIIAIDGRSVENNLNK